MNPTNLSPALSKVWKTVFFNLGRQLIWEKENSEFKPAKINFVFHPAYGEEVG